MEDRVLVADIGGTHCRLALARHGVGRPQIEALRVVPTPRGDLAQALRVYLDQVGCARPAAIGVAAAGRVRHLPGRTWVALTNVELNIEQAGLERLCAGRTWLANDLGAVAAALPVLRADELLPVGTVLAAARGLRLVVGVGTGFGAAALSADGRVIETEAGHADLAAVTADEREWLDRLAPRGRTGIETVLSGPGILRLHGIIAGQPCTSVDQLLLHWRDHHPPARQTLAAFSTWLGRACGNLALGLGAWGGVYFAGGVLAGLGEAFDPAAFRRGFEDKAPFGADLAAVPVQRIAHPQPALLGMARLALGAA